MDGGTLVEIETLSGIDRIPAAEWDACAAPECADGGSPRHPFVTHAVLSALEASGSAVPETGWAPHHLVARVGGRIAGAMPLYLKDHSQGEYVFDHAWANACARAQIPYYPKLQSAVPFTPVTGPRLLVPEDGPLPRATAQSALLQGAVSIAAENGLSSLHMTFCTDEEWEIGGTLGLLQRIDQQFHWIDRGYGDYAGFLGALASRKRKALRKEREKALEAGLRVRWLRGAEIERHHRDAFWVFYQDTGARKWGRPYLTRRCFEMLQQALGERLLLILAERDGHPVAGALNIIGRDTVFGRYWGCTEEHPFLHFELCYHQAIDFALAHGLTRVEAGAQGGHKLARGYEPVTTRSLHWIGHPGLRQAVAQYLVAEREAVDEDARALLELTPFRKG